MNCWPCELWTETSFVLLEPAHTLNHVNTIHFSLGSVPKFQYICSHGYSLYLLVHYHNIFISSKRTLEVGFVLKRCTTVKSIESQLKFRRNISPPFSGLPYNPSKITSMKHATLLAASFMLVSCLVYSSTLKMETTYFSERLLSFNGLQAVCVLKGRTFHNYCYENLISFVKSLLLLPVSQIHRLRLRKCNVMWYGKIVSLRI
jgi:hypothetical protein